jgi:hypothetical protein
MCVHGRNDAKGLVWDKLKTPSCAIFGTRNVTTYRAERPGGATFPIASQPRGTETAVTNDSTCLASLNVSAS